MPELRSLEKVGMLIQTTLFKREIEPRLQYRMRSMHIGASRTPYTVRHQARLATVGIFIQEARAVSSITTARSARFTLKQLRVRFLDVMTLSPSDTSIRLQGLRWRYEPTDIEDA